MNADHSRSRIVCVRAMALTWALAAGFVLAVPNGASIRADGERLTSRQAPKVTTPPTVKIGAAVRTGAGERRRLFLEDGVEILVNQNTNLHYPERDVLKLSAGEVFVRVPARKRNQETATFTLLTPERQVRTGAGDLAVRSGGGGTSVLVTRGTAKVSAAGQQVDVAAGQQLRLDRNQPAPLPRASHVLDWTRELLAADSPLVPGSQHAGGALVAFDPDGQEAKISLRKFHIDVHIEDGFARTTIDQIYFNHEAVQLEGTFYFPLPPDASLSRLAMYVNGRLMEGGMVERHEARRIYDTIRYTNYDPALLEWVDGSTFKMRVFPMESRTEKRIILSYTQKLPGLYGQTQYRFPAGHSMQLVEHWSFHARVKDGGELAWTSPSHPAGATAKTAAARIGARREGNDLILAGSAKNARTDRDVVLNLIEKTPKDEAVRLSAAAQDGAQYLMVRFRPNLQIENPKSAIENRTWVFLFESSGDRNPLLARAQIEVIRNLLGQASPDDSFLVAAGTRVRLASAKPQAANLDNVKSAVAFLENSHLIGALDLGSALAALREHLPREQNPYLVHVGSGIAAMGERRADALVKMIPDGTRYVGIGVGRRWDRTFMKAAAEVTGGHFTQINPDEPIAWRTFDLAATLRTPRLMNVQVAADDGLTEVLKEDGKTYDFAPPAFLLTNQALAQGEELCALTRVGPALGHEGGKPAKFTLPHSLRIGGFLDGKRVEYSVKVPDMPQALDTHLPRTWAKLEIDRLLAENPAKHKDAVIALSKAMYVMTPFTSLLVLEHEDLYTQYKVDRGRKDHWAMYPCPEKTAVVYEPEDGQANGKKAGQKLTARKMLETVVIRGGPPLEETARHTEGRNEFGLPVPSKRSALSPAGFISGLTPAGVFTPDLNLMVPIKTGSFGLSTPSFGGFPGSDGNGLAQTSILRPQEIGTGRGGTQDVQEQIQELQAPLAKAAAIPAPMGWFGSDSPGPALAGTTYYSRLFKNVPDPGPTQFWTGLFRESEEKASPIQNPSVRMGRLLNVSEDLRQIDFEWQRSWFTDEPSHLTPVRVSGGIFAADPLTSLGNSLLYKRPDFKPQPGIYHDLVAYARGMNTSLADIEAVLEAEALPSKANKRGKVDAGARKLLKSVRATGWQALTLEAKNGQSGNTIYFDGTGRYVYERQLPPGIKERVVCDGKTLWHLYPQLMIGAQREVSRFHRADLSDMVPWALPPAEDLARGADLKLLDEQTIAIIPFKRQESGVSNQGSGTSGKAGKAPDTPNWLEVHLFFGADGRLSERRVVRMPKKEIVYRQVITAEGDIRLLDGKGKELAVRKGKLRAAEAPDLTADTKNLIVLPMPFRTAAHVKQALRIEKKNINELRFKEALPLFAAEVGAGNAAGALQLFQQVYHAREQRQLGFYVLLAACGVNLDATGADVLAEHPDEPLAQYLALHSSPVLRAHASQWAVNSVQWKDPYLQHLGLTHALLQRWQNAKLLQGNPAKVEAEKRRALDYITKHKESAFAWALLCLMQDRVVDVGRIVNPSNDAGRAGRINNPSYGAAFHALQREVAEAWRHFEDSPALSYAARYERARGLWRGGKKDEARKQFLELYEATLKKDVLPAIDQDFRAALLDSEGDPWSARIRQTAAQLIEQKHRPAVLVLASQCWQLDDQPLANSLVSTALADIADVKERQGMTLAAVEFYRETAQFPRADELLQVLLADPKLTKYAGLWRLAAALAEQRDIKARAMECLEKALDAEFHKPAAVIDLKAVRADYGKLLEHHQGLADAMVALKLEPPAGFLAKVVRTADRWRALDSEGDPPCQAAAHILQRLGGRDLGWDYLTTPIAHFPSESGPWLNLANTLNRQGDLDLADRAFKAAFESEPTNAQILWDRAQNLRQSGKSAAAQTLFRQLADGRWEPRFQGLRNQARAMAQGQ